MGSYYCGLEGRQLNGDRARGQCAHEVARARPDAETEEKVQLIRGSDSGALAAKQESAEAGKSGRGPVEACPH